ncbi:MAG: translocation/assembly module TamB domain-containing protein, partial [Halanaerobiales bacterium]
NSKKEYSFDFEGRDLDIGLLNKFSYFAEILDDQYTNLGGTVNLITSITGSTLELEGLNASGHLEVLDSSFNLEQPQSDLVSENTDQEGNSINKVENSIKQKVELDRVSNSFYLSEGKLFLHEGLVTADWGEVEFSGELGIIENTIDLKIDSQYINPGDFIAEYYSESAGFNADKDITGAVRIEGSIEGELSSPLFTASISSDEGSVIGYRFDRLSAGVSYLDRELKISNLELYYNRSLIKGHAFIDMTAEQPSLDGELSLDKLSYEVINSAVQGGDLSEETLPIEGDLSIRLSFNGLLTDPDVIIQGSSDNTDLYMNNMEIALDKLELYVKRVNGGFNIDYITANVGDGIFRAGGFFSQESIDIGYQLNDFPLDYLGYTPVGIVGSQEAGKLTGRLDIDGSATGAMSSPIVNSRLYISDINYQQNPLGILTGNLEYSGEKLRMDTIIWKIDQKEYIIDGEISNILSNPELDFSLNTEKGHLKDFVFLGFNEGFESLSLYEYNFQGETLVKGKTNNPFVWVNFDLINNDNADDIIQIYGSISDRVDLSVQGDGITIDKFMDQYTDADVDGKLQFRGSITGLLDSVDLSLDTSITDATFGEIPVEDIHGKVEIAESAILRFDQKAVISSDNSMDISGSMPFAQGVDGLNINMALERFPLQLVSVYSTYGEEMSGLLSGDVELSGGLREPVLTGKLRIKDTSFDVGLPDRFSELTGDIILEGRQITVQKMSGKYGDGNISIVGSIRPFAEEENWDLSLSGENLPFDYGSFKGKFDPDMTISGSLTEPLIRADILTHQFNVMMPFKWPTSGTGNNSLLFDFTLHPGKDVYLVNENINVLIQQGSLNINNLDGQIVFRGELSSKQGIFDFYNNKFILEEGSAVFERQFDVGSAFIPKVDVRAWTNVSGTRVEVLLSGPANNMVTTFSSLPPLDQDEILTLLSSRGGLGEFASGDFDNVIQSELYRLIYSQLQLDFVEGVQEGIKNIFRLDRLEVDVYDLGWNDQLTVYVGKQLNDRLYLEYTDVIITDNGDLTTDEQGELSLQYLLDESITLETSWQGEDEFSLSIETNLEF